MDHPDEELIEKAIALGTDPDAVGALLVRDGEIIASGTGAIFERPDATAHSEVEVIREACQRLDSERLDGCWLYSTHEPCPMCMAACCWARIEGVVFALTDEEMPDDWGTIFSAVSAREIRDGCEHRPALHDGFMRAEATQIHH